MSGLESASSIQFTVILFSFKLKYISKGVGRSYALRGHLCLLHVIRSKVYNITKHA